MSFLSELRRRKVIRVAGLYLVTAWLAVQVAETILPVFGAPDWVLRSLIVVLALGFVPAVLFAWAFELTPEGFRRDAQVDPETRAAGNRRLDIATMIVAVLAIALLVADRLSPDAPPRAAAATAAGGAAAAPGDGTRPAADPDGGPGAGAPAAGVARDPAEVSIAVLPFADLSPEGDQAWFAEGISEEILNVLAKVDGLSVASRTSSFQFRAQQGVGIPAIAEALKVRHVLEGSVRKAGDRIRITAQLIDAHTDAHLWSETFDRTLTTDALFDIQDEIATAIVSAIGENLGGIAVGTVDGVPQRTDNVDAYGLYLQARTLYYARVDFDRVADLLGRAVELDPQFADALAMRAATYTIAPEYGLQLVESTERSRAITRELAAQALAIVPEHALAIGAISLSQDLDLTDGRFDGTFADVMAGYERAHAADPGNVDLINWNGYGLMRAGQFARAATLFRACRDAEPAYAPCRANLAGALLMQGERDRARDELLAAAAAGALGPDIPVLITLHALGEREAFYFVGMSLSGLRGWHDFAGLYDAIDAAGDHAVLRARLAALDGQRGPNEQVQALLIALGEHDRTVNNWVVWLPAYRAYRQSPAFHRQMIDSGIVAYWRSEGFPPGCRAAGDGDFACD